MEKPIVTYGFTTYDCDVCGKQYKTENGLSKHVCETQKRIDILNSLDGQMAFSYFVEWFRLRHFKEPSREAFMRSIHFKGLLRFVNFAIKVNIPDAKLYISMMVQQNLHPTLWCHDSAYTKFIQHLDQTASPMKLANISINTILSDTRKRDIPTEKFFDNMPPNKLIHLVRQRQLSPWILLHSNKFKQYFNGTKEYERIALEGVMNPQFWQMKFSMHSSFTPIMKDFITELGL